MRKRDIKKQFYLNEDEQQLLAERAGVAALTEAAYIRALITGRVPKPKPDKEFYDDMRALYSVSNNLNQLTIKSHTYDYIDTDELKKILSTVSEFITALQNKYLVPDEGG